MKVNQYVATQIILDGLLHTSLFDKRDAFNFHITDFLFLSSYIQSLSACGVFISQPTRYVGACSSYECFVLNATRNSNKLFMQGYVMVYEIFICNFYVQYEKYILLRLL